MKNLAFVKPVNKLWIHYAHLLDNSFRVKHGERVERGQLIAQVGGTGGGWTPHLHFSVRKDLYRGPHYYPVWKSKRFVKKHWMDPYKYLAQAGVTPPMAYTRVGYDWLQWTGRVPHPGIDMNAGRDPYDDEGMPVFDTQTGRVIHIETNHRGWGNHILIEVDKSIRLISRVNEALRKAGAKVNIETSAYWQFRIARGDKKDFPDLVNGIKWRIANKRYPHTHS